MELKSFPGGMYRPPYREMNLIHEKLRFLQSKNPIRQAACTVRRKNGFPGSRPAAQRRRESRKDEQMKAAVIYMASGFGNRFGSNKLTALLEGKPLYQHSLGAVLRAVRLLNAQAGWQARLVAVSQYGELLEAAGREGAKTVLNERSHEGITASLTLGTLAAGEADLYVYCVADQPRLRAETIADFIQGFWASKKGIGCVASGGKRGNPAAFLARYRKELLSLTGDKGGSQVIRRHEEELWLYEAAAKELADVDRLEDLSRM